MKEPCNYEMLSNYKYAKLYQYVPVELRDSEVEISSANLLERVLNIGYMPVHSTFEFMRDNKIMRRDTVMKRKIADA